MCRILMIAAALVSLHGCSLIALPLIIDCPKPPALIMQPPRTLLAIPEQDLSFESMANTVSANYKRCHDNADQLRSCQAWAREVSK
jgi:hypothetical protein